MACSPIKAIPYKSGYHIQKDFLQSDWQFQKLTRLNKQTKLFAFVIGIAKSEIVIPPWASAVFSARVLSVGEQAFTLQWNKK